MPDPSLILLQQQLGRVPSLCEIMAALGAQAAPSIGQEAGAQDDELTLMLRGKESMGQHLIRMLLLGQGPSASPTLEQHGQDAVPYGRKFHLGGVGGHFPLPS